MSIHEIKNKAQIEALNTWRTAGYCGTLELATGVGKSRCGVLAAKKAIEVKPDARILILTPTQTIRDNAWKEEFKKWGAQSIFDKSVTTECIQSAWKREGEFFDLIIADEIHNYAIKDKTEQYSYYTFFEKNKWNWILGLSATIDKDQRENINKIAPVVYRIDTMTALKHGLISPFTLYTIPVSLTEKEQEAYSRADSTVNKLFPIFNWKLDVMFACMKDKAQFERLCKINGHDFKAPHIANAPFVLNNAVKKRKEIIYNASEKLGAIKQIVPLLDHNGIIFSQTTDFADNAAEVLDGICLPFHSKISAKKRKEALKVLEDGRTKVRVVSTAKALNEGANLKNVKFAIIASGTSKSIDLVQRIGRAVRLDGEKTATIVRLYVKGSQEEKWLKSSLTDINYINLDSVDSFIASMKGELALVN